MSDPFQSGGAFQTNVPFNNSSSTASNFVTTPTLGGTATTAGSSAIVSTTDTQTLTNKTLTSPTINTPTTTAPIVTDSVDYKVLAASITYSAKPAAAVITGFSWTVVAGATYVFDVLLNTTMTTVGGLTASFKLTTATLTSIQYLSYAATAADASTAVSTQGTTTTDATAIFDSKTAAYTYVRLQGSFVVNAGGTFAFFGTQNTSGTAGDVTIILLGSYAKLTRAL